MSHRFFFTIVALVFVVTGCSFEEMMIGSTDQTIIAENALAHNKLAGNKLAGNSLATHAIVVNRLGDGTLEAGNLEGLEETEDGREYLKYLAQCAFADGDTLEVVHDSTTYEFPGLLNLAPGWENGSLSAAEKEMMSACLIAHVNGLGVSVTVSMRSAGNLTADAAERAAYPVYEGTFFGQVFDADEEIKPIHTIACQGDDYDVAVAHSPTDRGNRICTDSLQNCEITVAGRCRDVCADYDDQYGWTNCTYNSVTYAHTVSVFLYAEDPDTADDTCGASTSCTGGNALATESSTTDTRAILSCRDSVDCAATCEDEDRCTLDGANSTGTFTATVDRAARAKVDAYNAYDADVTCDGTAAECEVDCKDSDSCDVACTADAACLLECDGATSCGFSTCHAGTATSCGGGVYVCGTTCP